jgi:hypothetical protein
MLKNASTLRPYQGLLSSRPLTVDEPQDLTTLQLKNPTLRFLKSDKTPSAAEHGIGHGVISAAKKRFFQRFQIG